MCERIIASAVVLVLILAGTISLLVCYRNPHWFFTMEIVELELNRKCEVKLAGEQLLGTVSQVEDDSVTLISGEMIKRPEDIVVSSGQNIIYWKSCLNTLSLTPAQRLALPDGSEYVFMVSTQSRDPRMDYVLISSKSSFECLVGRSGEQWRLANRAPFMIRLLWCVASVGSIIVGLFYSIPVVFVPGDRWVDE